MNSVQFKLFFWWSIVKYAVYTIYIDSVYNQAVQPELLLGYVLLI